MVKGGGISLRSASKKGVEVLKKDGR